MTRKIKTDGGFVPLGGGGAPLVGDALDADVVAGKTFSSLAAGSGVTGVNTSNATVPENAPIQPYQAYVDYAAHIIYGLRGYNNVIAPGLSYLDVNALVATAINFNSPAFFDSYGTYNFSDGTLSTANIDSLLAVLVSNQSSALLNLSGADMGVPTPLQYGTQPEVTSDPLYLNGVAIPKVADQNGRPAWEDNGSGNAVYYNSLSWVAQLNGGSAYYANVNSTTSNPFEFDDWVVMIGTVNPVFHGQLFMVNLDIETATSNGATITVMEYVNRMNTPQLKVTNSTHYYSGSSPNGIYLTSATINGKLSFNSYDGVFGLYWSGTEWEWYDYNQAAVFATSTDDTEFPWEAVFVSADPMEAPPVATLAAGFGVKESVTYSP